MGLYRDTADFSFSAYYHVCENYILHHPRLAASRLPSEVPLDLYQYLLGFYFLPYSKLSIIRS